MCQYRLTKKQFRKALAEIEAELRDLQIAVTRDTHIPVKDIVAQMHEAIIERIAMRHRYERDRKAHREGCKRRYGNAALPPVFSRPDAIAALRDHGAN